MTPQPNPEAGRTRRNVEELHALACDCGWRAGYIDIDSTTYHHPDSPGELLDIPTSYLTHRFAERYDAALARLTPGPVREHLPSRQLSRQLIAAVTAHNADTARAMCHWVQGRGNARADTHEAFHFGDQPGQSGVCPYEAVAAVLTGQPDPRDAPRNT